MLDKILGKKSSSLSSPVKSDKASVFLNIISKNFLVLPNVARDLNVARQAAQKLVKLEGGKPRQGADRFFLKASEREAALEAQREKIEGDVSPTPIVQTKKKESIWQKIKKMFSLENILIALASVFSIAALTEDFQLLWDDLVESFKEWASNLWETIKTKFDEWVQEIKTWFTDLGKSIKEKVSTFINDWIVEPVKNAFGQIGSWFEGFVEKIKGAADVAIGYVKGIWDKFMGVVNSVKEKWDKFKNTFIKEKPEDKVKREQAAAATSEFGYGMDEYEPPAPPAPAPKPAPPPTPPADPGRAKAAAASRKAHRTRGLRLKSTSPEPAPAAAAPATAPTTPAPTTKKKPESTSSTKTVRISASTGKQAMIAAMDNAKITDPTQRAAIMAQVGHESGGFTTLSENLNYRPTTLMKLFGKKFSGQDDVKKVAAGGPKSIAERIYGGRMGNAPEGGGDGWNFRGRGFIQLTGKNNYTRFGYVNDPDQLTKPAGAAESALKYMAGYKGDWGNIKKLTKFVNGGYIGLKDRQEHFEAYLNDPQITGTSTAASGSTVASASSSIASGQRQQMKPQTPIIVNAPQTTVVAMNKTIKRDSKKDLGSAYYKRLS